MRLTLVPSPLLSPAVWEPTATALRRRGEDVAVPASYPAVRSPADVLAHLLDEIPAGPPTVLVPHSNAGLYVAALAAERTVAGVVFADAGVPCPGPTTPTAPPALLEALAAIVGPDGLLPAWSRWWPEDEVAGLFPDRVTRARVEAEQARLPLTYFRADLPSPPGWLGLPAAYLAFGDGYAAELADARRRGWPVEQLRGAHLHPLVDPVGVADAVLGLVGRLGLDAS